MVSAYASSQEGVNSKPALWCEGVRVPFGQKKKQSVKGVHLPSNNQNANNRFYRRRSSTVAVELAFREM